MVDFSAFGRIHFLGIGGVSTSLLARFLHANGVKVSGTDRAASDVFLALQEEGLAVWTGFLPEKTGRPDAVVYSSAIPPTDPEFSYLSSCNIPMYERFDLLGFVAEKFGYSVCVAGTHGKTTTTAMISKVLSDAGKNLFAHVGGDCPDLGKFLYTGNDYFVCEACEYKKSLLALHADIALVLNAELDHPDTYKDISEVYDTFDLFLENAKKNSAKILCGDDVYPSVRQEGRNILTFGRDEKCTFRIVNEREKNGRHGCDVEYLGKTLYSFNLSVVGKHNLLNAAACCAVAFLLKIDPASVEKSLNTFCGVRRRFEYKGQVGGASVYTDYAHHPSEISACLDAAREVLPEGGKLWVAFQPHTFSRTKALADDFRSVLSKCDGLLLVKEYAARETSECGMSSHALFGEIIHNNKYYCDKLIDAARILIKETAPYDVIVVLGAGDIDVLCDILISTD